MSLEKSPEIAMDIPMGEGREKRVFLEPNGFARADFLMQLTKSQTESIFYVAKIAHSLSPDIFPKPVAAWKDEKGVSHFRSEYVEPDKKLRDFHDLGQRKDAPGLSQSEFFPLTEEWSEALQAISTRRRLPAIETFVDAAQKAGLLFVENAPANFSLRGSTDDSEVPSQFKYTDIEPAWKHSTWRIDPEKIRDAAKNLPPHKRDIIDDCLTKITTLREQEKDV